MELHLRKDIDKLVKWRATKMIEGLEGFSYMERLRILNLPTSDARKKIYYGKYLIEVYKIFKGSDRLDPGWFFDVADAVQEGEKGCGSCGEALIWQQGVRRNGMG
jgi:hypothetical protein